MNYEDNIALHRISKRKKSARKKQDKCLIKVCEKIMNDVRGLMFWKFYSSCRYVGETP